MKRKGFILVDILGGLFLLGLISVISIPLLSSSYKNFSKINTRTEMSYIGEGVYERLSSKDEYSTNLLLDLTGNNEVLFSELPSGYLDKYDAKIIRLNEDDNFIEIKIVIIAKNSKGVIKDVEFEGSILK